MAWTTPKTWTTGELVPASDLNTYLRDNANYLYDTAVPKIAEIPVTNNDTAISVQNGIGGINLTIPTHMDGWILTGVSASLNTASTSGIPTFQIRNVTAAVDMLSTKLTIDANEKTSETAATAAVINTANDDVSAGDQLRIDCDVAGTGAKGANIMLQFEPA